MKKLFTVILLGSALTLSVACDDKKDDKKAEDKKSDAKGKGDDKKADAKGKAEEKAEVKAEEKKAEEAKAEGGTAAAAPSTGDPVCDELIKKTMCSYEKAGAAVPAEAKKAFEDGVKAWTEALKNEATKKATSDACKASLDGGKAGFDAVGC
jgi:hypothetical protein